jgi:hypothetical protein
VARALPFAVALLLVSSCPPAAAAGPRLKDVLARVESYLTSYETQLATLVAEEQYVQWTVDGRTGAESARRSLTSDFGFLRLPGRSEWLGLRDTFVVDGTRVPDRQGRLDRLLAEGSAGQPDLARRIVDENARYNLGVVARTINVPMLALDLLGPRNQWRVSARKRGEEDVDGRKVWTIVFDERERPTLVRTPRGQSRPAHGSVSVDPADGSILRTEVAFDRGGDDSPETKILVRYRRDDAVELLVPVEMQEFYGLDEAGVPSELHGLATYGNFRRFRSSGRIILPPPR